MIRAAVAWLRSRWARLAAADRVVYALVAVLLLAAPLVAPSWRRLDPRIPVSSAYHTGADTDPWGRRWERADHPYRVYSAGPDGEDQGGAGDDVAVLSSGDPRPWLFAAAGELLFGVAVLLGAGWEGLRFVRRALTGPRRSAPLELALAAGLALPPAAITGAVLASQDPADLPTPLREPWRTLDATLLVPVPLALGGSVFALAAATLAWIRLGRPRDGGSAS